MNSQTPAINAESAKHNRRIKFLLEKLRNKLKTFSVLDSDGILLGEVKDVKLDTERQLNLVVSTADNYSGEKLILLRSNHIQQVDSVTKSLFVDISKLEIERMAVYRAQRSGEVESSERIPKSATEKPEIIDQNATVVSDTSYDSSNSAVEQGARQRGSANTLLVDTASRLPQTDRAKSSVQHQNLSLDTNDSAALAESEANQNKLETVRDSLKQADSQVVEQEVIRLLEERLIVDRGKRKIGDVIVRKEIETRMVQVPVRYEKLIVEKVGPERERLAEIELGTGDLTGIDLTEAATSEENSTATTNSPTVSGEFKSPKSASLFLNAVALQRHHGCAQVRVELVLENAELQQTYQEWFSRCSGS